MKKLSIKINLDKEDFYRILKVFFSITIYIVGIFSHEIYTNYIIEKATKTSTTQVLDNFSNLKSVTNLIDAYTKLSHEYFDTIQNNSSNKQTSAEPYWNFIDVCNPYEGADSGNYKTYTPKEQIKIAGEFRSNGFTNLCHNTYLLFNLGAKYRELSFSIGHVDGEAMLDVKISIYLDGQHFNSYIIKAQEMPINISIPLQNVQQLKFSFNDGETNVEASTKIGVYDMIIK
ncbi:NPCBM/NEW2 domain-containing protein [Lachnospira eligens]|uniref:Glycosyl hydrolase family 98 putative carbohydrate-binding module domain-containing protein n=1 Tax=Lachnospira eligens TaxID=39485 RepID=A0A174ZE80_9FIRM|nr:NPCBM/NEW2 domain-containing protein [Lachnospira eligens]OLA17187.1 MAG: hypothetical protein BHW24_01810 [Lachnospira eligens]CUQ85605.1 Uncharacterised protein [Lachnospira eligens]